MNLELSTGVPLLYIYKEGSFMKRGSPVGSSEAGVYALTWARIFHLCLTLCFLITGVLIFACTISRVI